MTLIRSARVPGRALVNANVHPMTTPDARAEAICWDGDHIVAVGTAAEVQAAAKRLGIATEDAGGAVVVPGFVDAHMHFLHVGVKTMRPDLRGCTSLQDALDRYEAWLRDHPGDDAVVAEGWDDGEWEGGADATRFPTKDDLDALADAVGTDRPLVMRRVCGHIAIASTAGLPPLRARWPEDHLVDMESGLVQEEASLYNNEVFPASDAMLDEAIQIACVAAHRIGVTTVGDYCQAPFRAAVLRAAEAGRLSVRLFESIYVQQLPAEISAGFRTGRKRGAGDWCRDGGLKVFLDGSFGGHTALLREPYADAETRGTAIWSDAEVDRCFQAAHHAGIQVHAHAIGDAAIDQGLDGFERLRQETDELSFMRLRHRFEHYELPQDDAIGRTREMGVWACSQPNFVGEWSAPGGMYEKRIGARYRLANRFRTFQERNIRFGFGSDGMPFGPLEGLQACLEHPEAGERLSVAEAVWYYTNAAAELVHWEDAVGSLEVGKKADLLVLDVRSLVEKLPTEWVILETVVDGRTVHRGQVPVPYVK